VAVSDSPFGPFRYIDSYRLDVAPAGEPNYQPGSPGMARDMNLFVDDDGTGYIIYSSEENYSLFVSKLDSTYTALSASPATAVKGVDFTRPYIGAHREAPAMFKFDGTYYLITSGATGWSANPARYATAESILGEWTDHGNPVSGPGASDTFSSQSTSVIPIDAAAGRFLFMGDRWTPADLAHAPYIWLPMTFGEGGSLSLQGPAQWRLEDLRPATRYTVAAAMPDHAWLGDASTLPTMVAVTAGGTTTTTPVVWDTAGLAQPGVAALRGTLPDGRTFTRSLVVVPRDLLYAVNAGGAATADWTTITRVAASEGVLRNSVPDQPYGADPSLATTWGYQVAASGTYGGAGDTIFSTLRYAKAGSDLTYRFDGLAPGSYTVHAGYYDPWPQANRVARVTVNGTVVAPAQTFTAQNTAATYADVVVGADGVLTYTLTPTRSPDIQVSWVMVARPRVAQTITFAGPAGMTFGDADLAGDATASSGLPITYAAAGDCILAGTSIHPTSAGSCTITASQAGDDDVRPAADVTRTFGVRPPVLDDFDRSAGPVGGNWGGATGTRSYRLAHHRLDAGQGGPLVFGVAFGPTQEASVTLATIDRGGESQGLLLKVQSASTLDRGALVVAYDARAGAVRVSSTRGGHARGSSYPKVGARFAAGDVLTARATAGGDVLIARNGTEVAVVTLDAADQELFNPLGGRIGIWTHDASRTVLDDFRGGSIGS